MSHRATIYSVCVHKRNRPNEKFPLGAIDEQGHYLGDFMLDVFNPANPVLISAGGNRSVAFEARHLAGENNDEVQVILNPGERGVKAKILKPDGDVGYEQTPRDTQSLRSGALFRLPREEMEGWWACHINSGRSFKSLVQNRLMEAFRQTFSEDLMLKITPCVNAEALKAAVEQDRLLSASLSKYERSPDTAEGGEWVHGDTGLKLRLSILPERGKRLAPKLVKKAIANGALGNIVEFGGISFDTAQFEVELENGQHRSFRIESPDAGHAFSEDIDPKVDDDGEFQDEVLFKELGRVLTELG